MPGKEIFRNTQFVSKIIKNKLEEIRISVLKNNMVDLRTYFYLPNDPEAKPTKKGVWLTFKILPNIISELENLLKEPQKDICLEFEKVGKDQIRVYTNEFKNAKLVHIRTFYSQNDEMKPGKGVSFPVTILDQVLEGLKAAMKYKE